MSDENDDRATTEPSTKASEPKEETAAPTEQKPPAEAATGAPRPEPADRTASDGGDEPMTSEAKLERRRVRRTAQTEVSAEPLPAATTPDEPPPATTTPVASGTDDEPRRPPRRRRRRRSRASRPVDPAVGEERTSPVTGSPSSSSAEGPEAPKPTRTPRARRRVKPPSDPPVVASETSEPRAANKRRTRRSRAVDGPQGSGRRRERAAGDERRRDDESGRRSERGTPARGKAPKPTPPADKTPQKPGKGEEMITLILHPQPKAAPARRKKGGRPMTAKEALRAKAAKRSAAARSKSKAEEPAAGTPLEENWLNAAGPEATGAVRAAGDAATRLIAAWQERTNAEAIAAVAYADGEDDEPAIAGPARKAARRALQVLKSRGVQLPERRPGEAMGSGGGATGEREPGPWVATFVPPDTNGMTFFSISQRLPGGRYRVADVVIRTDLGIMHASSGKLAGKQIRRWRQRVESRLGTAPVEVPVDWARYRIAAARQQNDVSGQVVPLGLDSCMPMFEPVPEEPPTHPVEHLGAELNEAEVTAATTDSEGLHVEPEFRSWLPERPALDEMLRNVGARVGAEGADDRELVDKVLAEELEAATDRFFTPEVREALAQRMKDAAISIRARLDEANARRVLGVAEAVKQAGLITSPPREIPFLLGFFRKSMALLAQQGDGRLQVPIPAAPAGEPPSRADDDATP